MTISPSDGCGFTRGPWYGDGREKETGDILVYAPEAEHGCRDICFIPEDDQQDIANARLIAASPTMYAYLERKANEGDGEAAAIVEAINAGLSTSKHSRLHNLARGGE